MRTRLFALGLTAALLTTLVSTAPAQALDPYSDAVTADAPSIWYRLDEASGTVLADATGNGRNANTYRYSGAFPFASPGQLGGPTSPANPSLGVADCNWAASTYAALAPNTFSQELWLKTTSTAGGAIAGFGNSDSGLSGQYDRRIYLNTSGQLSFGALPSSFRAVTSPQAYNDGKWHQVVGTLGPSGMLLYADGVLVASDPTTTSGQSISGARWRLGCDSFGGPWSHGSGGVAGQIDDAALYLGTQLSASRIAAHYAAALGAFASANVTGAVNPSFSFTVSGSASSCNGVTPNVTATATSIPFGTINAGVSRTATQQFTVASNSGMVFIAMRGSPSLSSGSNSIPALSAPYSAPDVFPALGTAGWGFTTPLFAYSGGKYAAMPNIDIYALGRAGGAVNFTDCIGYRVQGNASTPAGAYTGAIIYTALPSF